VIDPVYTPSIVKRFCNSVTSAPVAPSVSDLVKVYLLDAGVVVVEAVVFPAPVF
jgi:hypothetical protein